MTALQASAAITSAGHGCWFLHSSLPAKGSLPMNAAESDGGVMVNNVAHYLVIYLRAHYLLY